MIQKFTKNVATIGPATETEETLKQLIEAGMNVARFNTKHSSPEWHQERIKRVRKVAKEMGQAVAVLLDLQGPEIRINLPGETPFELEADETCIFTHDENFKADKKVLIPINVVKALQVGNMVLLDDGFCELEVAEVNKDHLVLKALGKCTVKHRKTMNIPGITIDMPSLVDADYEQLDGAGKEDNVDFVGLSFVRNRADIIFLRKELEKRNIRAQIIAKIETQAALDNLEEIVSESEAVMIARGDLGVEVPYEELVFWQREIINLCRLQGKPVIVATQMLSSMVSQPRPTRAEVSDVAHAIYDNTDAVMLSEETTIGDYPVKAVKTQASIASFNEDFADNTLVLLPSSNNTEILTKAAIDILETSEQDISAIICLTGTGHTARLLSRFRPHAPVIAVTNSEDTYYTLALAYGVNPELMLGDDEIDMVKALAHLKKKGVIQKDEKVLLVHGMNLNQNMTSVISLINVE
ncbi:MAG: pyruvate kinase [Pseudomonadales bacterium]|jgi:pyruvate kinase|nr:pyruvate kinase [Pseudomonadales bacterium]